MTPFAVQSFIIFVRIALVISLIWKLLNFVSPLHAIVMVQPLEYSETVTWSSEIQLSFQKEAGNVEMQRETYGAQSTYKSLDKILHIELQTVQGKNRGVRDINRQMIQGRRLNPISENIDFEIFGQLQSDEFVNLKHRSLIGNGLRWLAVRKPWLQIYLGSGLFFESQRFGGREDPIRLRGNFYFAVDIPVSETLSLSGLFYHQPDLRSGGNDLRSAHAIGLRSKLSDWISLQWTLFDRFYSNQPAPFLKTDSTQRLELQFTF